MSDTIVIPANRSAEESFGKYQVLSELGEGAMGKVYKCFDPDFQRMVAIKTVHGALLNDGSANEFRERFRNEMRAAGKLTHPNIVSVFDAGEKEGCPYFVMEFVEGQELKHMLDTQHDFSIEEAVSIIKGVLRGLSNIHDNGITHRDLKPANIFVSTSGNAKIADFGIAKLDSSDMTQIGTVIGSPKYMAPEQCLGEPVDARSDLFAVGIVLYELLTGKYCFEAETTSGITQKILNVEVQLASDFRADIPRYLDNVLVKALNKKASERFQTALDFLNALDVKAPPAKPSSSKMGLIGGGVLSLAVLGGVTGWMLKSSPDPEVSAPPDATQSASPANETPVSAPPATAPKREIKTLSPEKSAKLAKLFKVAETYKRIGRLVTPSGSNAYDAYQIALSIDPGNQDALNGIADVRRAMIDSVQASIDAGEDEQAMLTIQAGMEVFPEAQAFLNLRDQISGQ